MPHALVKNFSLPELPLEKGGITFEFATKMHKGVGLVSVKTEGYRFFLRYYDRDGKTLLKYDKTTRIPKLSVLKNAINTLAEASKSTIIASNTVQSKKDWDYPNHKTINYFMEDFSFDNPVWIEIGFGSGRHLLHNAKNRPEVSHIGIEIHKPSTEQVLKQCKIQGIENISVIDTDARTFLEILPANSIEKIFLHFPVPWPKAPHRRVVSHRFIEESLRVLKKGGTFELRTDERLYYDYTHSVIMDFPQADITARKNFFLDVSSKYEERWRRLEKDFFDLTLYNHDTTQTTQEQIDFTFSKFLPFGDIVKNIHQEPVVKSEYLMHIQEVYPIDEQSGILKVTLGSKGSPEAKYLLVKEGTICYYPSDPHPVKATMSAHKLLEETIFGGSNTGK